MIINVHMVTNPLFFFSVFFVMTFRSLKNKLYIYLFIFISYCFLQYMK